MPNLYRPRLRVLLDPVYITSANLSGSSTYRRFTMIARELVKRGHYVYWCIPDRDNYVPDPIEEHPQVGVIRTQYIQDQFVVDGLIPTEFFNAFNRVSGEYHIDMVLTCRNSVAAYYKRLFSPPRYHDNKADFTDKGYGVPVVIIEDFVQNRAEQHVSEAYWLMQCLGYLTSEFTIFPSSHNISAVTGEMLDYFVGRRVREFSETKARMLPVGISCAELDEIYEPDRWKTQRGFRVVSIGRIFGKTHLNFLPWFDYLYKTGRDVQLTISLSGAIGGPMRKKLTKIGFNFEDVGTGKQFRILENNNRVDYIQQLRGYHAFVCPLSHSDHPAALMEAVYMGLPGVIPKSDYQETFFPDWPWVIAPKDTAGLLGLLDWIRENPEEAREAVLPFRERIREQYNAQTNVVALVDMVEEAARSNVNRFKTSKGVIDILKELKGERYSWDDVVAYLRKSGRLGVSVGDMSIRTTFTYARGAIHHAMHMAGFVDDCTTPVETYVRRDVFDKPVRKKKTLKRVRKST